MSIRLDGMGATQDTTQAKWNGVAKSTVKLILPPI